MQLQQTQRHNVKLRLGISGASGFGKSYSALQLAYGMTQDWSKIAVIDTENSSASLYSDLGNFKDESIQIFVNLPILILSLNISFALLLETEN